MGILEDGIKSLKKWVVWAILGGIGLTVGLLLTDNRWEPFRPKGASIGTLILKTRTLTRLLRPNLDGQLLVVPVSSPDVLSGESKFLDFQLAQERLSKAIILDRGQAEWRKLASSGIPAHTFLFQILLDGEPFGWMGWNPDGQLLLAKLPRNPGSRHRRTVEEGYMTALEFFRLAQVDVPLRPEPMPFFPISPDSVVRGGVEEYVLRWNRPVASYPGLEEGLTLMTDGWDVLWFDRTVHGDALITKTRRQELIWMVPGILGGLVTLCIGVGILLIRLRRDSIDFRHVTQMGLLVFLLIWARQAAAHPGVLSSRLMDALPKAILGTLVLLVVLALAEAMLRTRWPQRLICLDLFLARKFWSRPLGRSLFLGSLAGMFFWGVSLGFGRMGEFLPAGWGAWPRIPGQALAGTYTGGPLFLYALVGALWWPTVAAALYAGWWPAVAAGRNGVRAPTWSLWLPAAISGILIADQWGPTLPGYLSSLVAGILIWRLWRSQGEPLAVGLLFFVPDLLDRASGLIFSGDRDISFWGFGLVGLVFLLPVFGAVLTVFGSQRTSEDLFTPGYVKKIAERERFQREMEIARHVQEQFLPKSPPEVVGLDIAHACVSAVEVGGDYLDYLFISEKKVGVVVGDVSGKGVSAAFFMTLIKGILGTCADQTDSPVEILRRMHPIFSRQVERGMFVTLGLMCFDLEKGEFRGCRAGHPPLLLVRDGKVQRLEPSGIAVGVAPDALFSSNLEECVGELRPGDMFLIASDGLFEAMNMDHEEFGYERVEDILIENQDLPAQVILSVLELETDKFAGRMPVHDDRTICVIKWYGREEIQASKVQPAPSQ